MSKRSLSLVNFDPIARRTRARTGLDQPEPVTFDDPDNPDVVVTEWRLRRLSAPGGYVLHRTDGPARIETYRSSPRTVGEFWLQNGEFYRANGQPTLTFPWSDSWLIGPYPGVLHRVGAPAFINRESAETLFEWHQNGVPYRENDLPTLQEGGRAEWRNTRGRLHRLTGPAVILPDGTEKFYINGRLQRTVRPDGRMVFPFRDREPPELSGSWIESSAA